MTTHRVVISTKDSFVVAKLEFERLKAFVILEEWVTGGEIIKNVRVEINPQFLVKLTVPQGGVDYQYKGVFELPDPGQN